MKYLPNLVTLFRIELTIMLNVYVYLKFGAIIVPLVLTALIFLSDWADGWLARKYHAETKFGMGFDAFADIFYVVLSYGILCGYHLLPLIGMALMLFKFTEFLITSSIINAKQPDEGARGLLIFDRLGKAVGILFYIMPISTYVIHEWFRHYNHSIHEAIGLIVCIMGLMVTLSSWQRIRRCLKTPNRSMT